MKTSKIFSINKIFLFIVIILIFILSSCTPSSNTPFVNVGSGTEGLVAVPVVNAPPVKVFQDSNFDIAFEVSNRASFDVLGAMILLNYDKSRISLEHSNSDFFDIDGRSEQNRQGDSFIKRWTAVARPLEKQVERIDTQVVATVCYSGTLVAGATVCLEPPLSGAQKSSSRPSCVMRSVSLSGGQGGPIGVVSVEPTVRSHERSDLFIPAFDISISNFGSGRAYDSLNTVNACSSEALPDNSRDIVKISVYLDGREKKLSCSSKIVSDNSGSSIGGSTGSSNANSNAASDSSLSTSVHLVNSNAVVRCSLPSGVSRSLGAHTSQLIVELSYGYSFSVAKSFEINKGVS